MATSTSYNASYVGVVQGLAFNRSDIPSTTIAATANTIATQVAASVVAVLSAAKQNLLTAIVAAVLSNRYTDAALSTDLIAQIVADYTTLTAHIVD